ncbi:MAG: hypothetical protein M3297_08320 [Thermoproteota archaeon]|nr:hypothetical protein [Thermoproteota archaeon]
MSADDKERDSSKLKEAASLLTKGGTLINEPCELCNGVQVRFRNNVTCINCGNEKSQLEKSNPSQREEQQRQQHSVDVREGSPAGYVSDQEYSKLNKQLRRRSGQEAPRPQTLADREPDIEEHEEYQQSQTKKEVLGQRRLQRASLLLIEKITSEITKIKEEEYEVEILRREAKRISIYLKLLEKINEVDRLLE